MIVLVTAAEPTTAAEDDDDAAVVTDEKKKLIVDDIVPKDFDWHLHHQVSAEYIGYNNQCNREMLAYFVPSQLPADVHLKIKDENFRPRLVLLLYRAYLI